MSDLLEKAKLWKENQFYKWSTPIKWPRKDKPFRPESIMKAYEEKSLIPNSDENLYEYVNLPAGRNLEITINLANPELKVENIEKDFFGDNNCVLIDDNMVENNSGTSIYRTKFSKSLNEVLPLAEFSKHISKNIEQKFLNGANEDIKELAWELVKDEEDTIKVLKKFYEFVHEKLVTSHGTSGITVDMLLKKYREKGYFEGNCKEATGFYTALCWSRRIPVRKALGKGSIYGLGFDHVWCEVFAPVSDKEHIIIPVDAAQGYFNQVSKKSHIFKSFLPQVKTPEDKYSHEPIRMKVRVV